MSDPVQLQSWQQASQPPLQHSWRGRLLTRLFHLYFRFQRPMTLGVRGMAFDNEGRIFLVRHTYIPGWHLPGGGIETDEAAHEALIREVAEEGNLILTEPPKLFGFYFNKAVRRDHIALYVLHNVMQTAPRQPDREIAEAGFFAPAALPVGVTAATRLRIAEVMSGMPPSPFW